VLAYSFSTLAGIPPGGFLDGPGSLARFSKPAATAVDASGNVYVADTGNDTIRKVTPAGVVTTFAGSVGISGSTDGTGTAAQFNQPAALAIDAAGNLYVADTWNNNVRKVTPGGVTTTLAGSGFTGSADGAGTLADFDNPQGIAVDAAGNVYVSDTSNGTIRVITPEGVVSTLAGEPGNSGSADGTGTAAQFDHPLGLAVDASGNVYVADSYNGTVRKITPSGVVTTFAGLAGQITFINLQARSVHRRLRPLGSNDIDGTGSAARFSYVNGLSIDASGNLYVADYGNGLVRTITPTAV
jgi:sugar lactone lactonase YvrE